MKLLNFIFDRSKKWGDEPSPHYLRGFSQVIWHGSCGPVTSVSGASHTLGMHEQSASKKRRIGYSLALGLGLTSLFGSSIATAAAPGGVESGLKLWFKADAGTSTTTNGAAVSSWIDQSPTTRTARQANASRRPTFVTDAFNFNPALGFNGSGNAFFGTNHRLDLNNLTGLPAGNRDRTMIAVANYRYAYPNHPVLFYYGANVPANSNSSITLHHSHLTKRLAMDGGLNFYESSTLAWGLTPSIVSGIYGGGNKGYFYANGTADTASPFTFLIPWNTVTTGGFAKGVIGDNPWIPRQDDWNGNIAEIIVYNKALNGSVELTKIESYLAIKYGISKAGDYINATGAKVWNSAANSAYNNGVLSIAVEAASALDQKRSKNTEIQISNSSLSDGQFFFVGHNNATTTISPTGPKIMYRVWKVAETGTVGTVTIKYLPGRVAYLWVDDDGNFANGGTTSYTLAGTGANVDFTDGQYFTFGTEASVAPKPSVPPTADSTSTDILGYHSLRSHNFPDRYISHFIFNGVINPVDTTTVMQENAVFNIIEGLAGKERNGKKCYSFQSINFPDRFLAHISFDVKLILKTEDLVFKQNATFCVQEPGLAGSGVSFISFNYPDRYIQHTGFNLHIDSSNIFGPAVFEDSTTFHVLDVAVLAGDSLTQLFTQNKLPLTRAWQNQGVFGNTTDQLLARISNFPRTKPKEVFLMIGVNDLITLNRHPTDIVGKIGKIIIQLKQKYPSTALVIQSLLPVGGGYTRFNSSITGLNNQLKSLASAKNLRYVDLHSIFKSPSGVLRPELTTDGLHLTIQGYQLWGENLQQ